MDKPSREGQQSSLAFVPSEANDVRLVKLADIFPDPLRKPGNYSDSELCAIARKFLRHGIGFPVTVAVIPESENKFMLLSREKIFRAALIAELERLPCIISFAQPPSAAEISSPQKAIACADAPARQIVRSDASPSAKSKIAIKDARFFFNSVYHAVDLMNQSGIAVSCGTRDEGSDTVLIITVPKSPPI